MKSVRQTLVALGAVTSLLHSACVSKCPVSDGATVKINARSAIFKSTPTAATPSKSRSTVKTSKLRKRVHDRAEYTAVMPGQIQLDRLKIVVPRNVNLIW
jgi:hypothetical protein